MFSVKSKPRRSTNKTEQCLRINLKEEPSFLDPRRCRNMSGDSQLHAMLFEGLMRLEPDGSLSCAQASSYEVSKNQKIYTFHLKETCWSDGTAVTAYDFEQTWKNILDPHFPSFDAHSLFCIKNAEGAKKGDLPLDSLGIIAKDEKTLIVELERPTAHFLHITASSVLFPINQTKERLVPGWYLEAGENFVSNGPFKLTLWRHKKEMVLEKNKHYHSASKVKLHSIHISMINSGIAALYIHASGLFDVIGLPLSPLPFDFYRELAQKDLLHIVNAPGTGVCMFNTKQFPFNNANMRKAFSYAINRQYIIDEITLLKEHPALGVIPPMLKKNKKRSFFKDNDIQAARACFQKGLEELGVSVSDLKGKIKFSFWKQDHGCPMLSQALQQQWINAFGVKVELEALDFDALHEKGKKGLFSIGYFVFLSTYQANYSIELLDRFKLEQCPRNYARWFDEGYAKLLNKSHFCASQEEYLALIDKAEELLMNEMPFAPIFHWNYALLVQPYVKGLVLSPLGYIYFDRVSIDSKKRNEK